MKTSDADRALREAVAALREYLSMEAVQDAGDAALAALEDECENWRLIAHAETGRRIGASGDLDDFDEDDEGTKSGPGM